jgi:SAM-dependent methyltransferase
VLVQASAEHLPFADAAFDVVLSTMSVRHWTDQAAGLREVVRVLAPGGLLGLADAPGRTPPRRPLWRHRAPAAPASLIPAGVDLLEVRMVHGYGPIATVAVVLARRTPDDQTGVDDS